MAFPQRTQGICAMESHDVWQEEEKEMRMKLNWNLLCHARTWIGICLAVMAFGLEAQAAVSTTTVQGTVYLANGAPGSGTLQLSWPAFTTSDNLAVAAGRTTVAIGADGFLSVNLAPNLGAAPAGLYYTAVYHMTDGTTSTEYWVVPEAAQANLASVRSQVMPAAQAVQAASKAYVDNAIQSLAQGSLTPVGGSLSGPLYLNGDPTQTLQAADKHYVDSAFSAAVPLSGATMLGALTGPSVTASVNKVLLVTAPPYNAKCDGATDDQASIQAAFNDAYSNGYSVEFPAGTCLTSTITIKGQSFFGHGKYVTTIIGKPGQDVFATPDPSTNSVIRQSTHIHDLSIQVDATVDASATAAGGNNTFSSRVTGTGGGLTPLAQPPAPGPLVFGSGVSGNCAGQIIADSGGVFDDFYLSCANFSNLNAEVNGAHLIGQPISIYNSSGALVLSTTITALIDATHLKLAASLPAAQSNLSGAYMNTLAAPWYIGNCGFAFPMADGSQNGGSHGMISGWVFENISIGQVSTALRQPSHTCAIFMQANNYGLNYEHIDTSMLYAGIVEALPYQNAGYVTWTPDTTKYLDINLSHHILPFVTYNGIHRIVEGLSIYGGAWDSPQSMGAWMFSAPTGSASGLSAYMGNASISRFYFECAASISGEVERFSGQSVTLTGGSTTQCGNGGSLGSWMTPGYLNWNVSDGSLDAQVGDFLQISGDHNTFTHTDLTLGAVTDNGFENRVQTGINNSDANLKRAFYANLNMPQDPVGKLNGDFLLNGNSAAPFASGSDLLTTCRDYRTLTPLCVNDPNGTELSRSYIHALANAGTVSSISTGSVASWNALMTAGSRIPLTQVYVVAQGRCQGATFCSSTFSVRDRVTGSTIGSCTYTFSSAWTIQGGASSSPCLINFSGVPSGDAIGWDTNAWTASGLTAVDISFVGFQPQHSDIVREVASSSQLASIIQAGAAGVPVNITAANWQWNGNTAGALDSSSPVGYSTAISNAWNLSAWNGSANLNGGALYPAVPSTISYLVQAPAVLTNSLAGALAITDTSLTLNVPITSSYASGGCFQIDQEIVCYSGALTAGATTVNISRGQYGTLAQSHASGAAVSTVGTGVFYAICNATNYAVTNVVFGANWSYVSSPFAAQNCSGTGTNIRLASPNGPSGQTYKIAAVQIAQNPGNPQATSSNQVPLSANAGNSQYGWTATKSLAGSGAAIPTGPTTSTSGNITTFASGNGQIQDSGISLGSVASLSSSSQQTFTGPVKINGMGVIYPQWYGAKGDGVHDDTAAIQAALDALKAAGKGHLYFPAGTYLVGANGVGLVNSAFNAYLIEGEGSGNTIITGSGSVILDLGGTDKVTLQHIQINGNGAAIGLQLCRYATPGTNGPGSGHVFNDVLISGTFTTAAVYSISSENNTWNRSEIISTSAVPLLYSSATNDLSVTPYRGTILASTNTATKIINSFFYSEGGAGAEAITFGGGGGAGSPNTSVIHSYFACAHNCIRFTGANGTYNLGPYEIRGNFFEATGSNFIAIQVDPVRLSALTLVGNYVSHSMGTNPDFYETSPGGGDIEASNIEGNAWSSNYPNIYYLYNSTLNEITQYTIRGLITNSKVHVPTLSGSPSISGTSELWINGALTESSLNVQTARKGTFTCTAAGTITVANTNMTAGSDVVITLKTAGGTITTPPAMKTVTTATGFTVLCGATDTSVYTYSILN